MENIDKPCPVPMPKLLKANSLVETCASCGTWVERYPVFLDGDYFWQCDKCGNTSTKVREGRPFAPKSRDWKIIVERFEELWTMIPQWDWDSIVTEPPMKSLDWNAIREWYESQNIYGAVVYFEVDETGNISENPVE